MDLIIGFALGVGLCLLSEKYNKVQVSKKTPGEDALCKECKFYKTVIEVIDNVEVVD